MQDPQRADQVGKYQKTRLADVETDRQFEKLEHLMRVDEPYLNAGLTLQELADELGIQAHLLSQVINRKAGVNFFQYVNAYRLRRVQKALQAPESANLSILDIAFEAGFNSKSSFNTLFRNATGKTPQQFRIAAGVSTSSTS
jgi:AraC-like DNA-binding protein